MIDPYRMIVINIIASLTVGATLLIYKFLYPKKRVNLFYLLLLISALPLISILRKGSYQSGDLSLHAKYAMQFFDNIVQGNLVPQWIGNHCAAYGCPEYIFIFFLPYYLVAILHFIGFSFIASIKFLLISSFVLSGIGMYKWMKEELGEISAFVASIFYLFAPYHLIDLHFRVSIGEVVSYAIIPFIFLSVKRQIETNKISYFFSSSILISLLILAHNATALVMFPFVFLYSLLVWFRNKRNYKIIILITASFLTSFLLTAFYWVPIIAEGKYIFYGILHQIYFHKFLEFFYSPHRFGLLFQGHMGELYTTVGYTQWLVVIIAFYLLFKKRVKQSDEKILVFMLISFSLVFIMMQSISKPIWDLFSFAKNIQFSWRLLIEASLFISVIAGVVVNYINSKTFVFILCTVTVLYTILNWGNRKSEPMINDAVLRIENVFTDQNAIELTTPVWVGIDFTKTYVFPPSHIQVLSGEATIVPKKRSQTTHQYIIDVEKEALIKENTFYYPGWKILTNNKEIPIAYTNKSYPGVITFKLKKGLHKVDVVFTDTIDRSLSKLISLATLFTLIFCFIYFKFFKPQRE